MFVKICGLSSEEHVRVAVDAGADAVGFVFAESVRKVTPAHAASITNRVPDTIKKVAVMLHPLCNPSLRPARHHLLRAVRFQLRKQRSVTMGRASADARCLLQACADCVY